MDAGDACDETDCCSCNAELMTSRSGFDIGALESYLASNGVTIQGSLQVVPIVGGRSNLTYRLSDGCRAWILRTPPDAGLTPSAHDVFREHRILTALQQTEVPVPTPVLRCEDSSIIGTPFTLTSFVTGMIFRTQRDLQEVPTENLETIHNELIRELSVIHSLEYERQGLRDFGRPDGFVIRQIERWRRQWDLVAERDVGDVLRLYTALSDAPPPEGRFGVVHGDFRIDNTILDADLSTVRAILDWEMAALGDPLTDLAWVCVCQHPSFDFIVGEPAASTSTRWPNNADTAERYSKLTGADLTYFDRYRALAFFKLAVIAEGITARFRLGSGSGRGFETASEAVGSLIAAGLSLV